MNMNTQEVKNEFSKRLNRVLDDHDIPPKGKNRQAIIAQMFGVTQKGARKWLEGESLPELSRGVIIARKFNISYEWLMTGRGPKNPPKRLSKDAQFLAQVFDMVDEKIRREIIDYTAYVLERSGEVKARDKINPVKVHLAEAETQK